MPSFFKFEILIGFLAIFHTRYAVDPWLAVGVYTIGILIYGVYWMRKTK